MYCTMKCENDTFGFALEFLIMRRKQGNGYCFGINRTPLPFGEINRNQEIISTQTGEMGV